jgi:hypothetical protein
VSIEIQRMPPSAAAMPITTPPTGSPLRTLCNTGWLAARNGLPSSCTARQRLSLRLRPSNCS